MISYDDLVTYLGINLKTTGLSVNPNWASCRKTPKSRSYDVVLR